MTLDIFKDPMRMVDDISALGLRHFGYSIPPVLFCAFVRVEAVRTLTDDKTAERASGGL